MGGRTAPLVKLLDMMFVIQKMYQHMEVAMEVCVLAN